MVRKLKQLKINLNEDVVNELVNHFKTRSSLDVFYQVGTGEISNQMLREFASKRSSIFNFLKSKITRKASSTPQEANEHYDYIVFGKEGESLDYSFAKCCNPIAGDPIFGFITINEGVKVHKKNCPNAISMQSNYAYRIMTAKWVKSEEQEFKVALRISGLDRAGLIADISKAISDCKFVKLTNINVDTEGNMFKGKVSVTINNNTTLKQLMQNIKAISGIDKVTRL